MTDWVGIVIAAAALILAFLGWRDGRKQAAESAADAKQAADSAALAAGSAARSADALEAQASRFSPDWNVESSGNSSYLLTNRNGEEASDVEVTLDAPWYFFDPDDGPMDPSDRTRKYLRIGAASSEMLFFLPDGTDMSAQLRVTWTRPASKKRESWSIPVTWLVR